MAKIKAGGKRRLKSKKPSASRVKRAKEGSVKDARPAEPKPSPAKVSERIQEKGSGLEVLKIIGFVIIGLILGTTVLMQMSGSEENARGDGAPGESCQKTVECRAGSICFARLEGDKRCFATCDDEQKCEDGLECTAAIEATGKAQARERSICVQQPRHE